MKPYSSKVRVFSSQLHTLQQVNFAAIVRMTFAENTRTKPNKFFCPVGCCQNLIAC